MNSESAAASNTTVAGSLLATVWPFQSPAGSEAQRRKKVILRNAQLAFSLMVAAGVIGAIATDHASMSRLHIVTLTVAALIYTFWCLRGLREPIRRALDDSGSPGVQAINAGTILYFGIQLGLAGLVFTLSSLQRGGTLAWLVLLPPVAHSVILLPRLGMTLVAVTITALLAGNVALRQGWSFVPSAAVAFSFAVIFTLVFTMLAVSAERSRGEVQKLADELAVANLKLREYAVEAEELAAARERNRMAREIHDSLGHYLTVVNVQIEAARALNARDLQRSREALDKAQSLTQEGLREIRRSVAALRASPLESRPLENALQQVVADVRAAGVNVEMEIKGIRRELSPTAELTLYRAAQEGLTNVSKHARGASARVVLEFAPDERVRLIIEDNGPGAPASFESERGFGLLGLRERAQLVGGEVRTNSAAGKGFTLEVDLPA